MDAHTSVDTAYHARTSSMLIAVIAFGLGAGVSGWLPGAPMRPDPGVAQQLERLAQSVHEAAASCRAPRPPGG